MLLARQSCGLRLGHAVALAVALVSVALGACSSKTPDDSDRMVNCNQQTSTGKCSCSSKLEYVTTDGFVEVTSCSSSAGTCCQLDADHCSCDPSVRSCSGTAHPITSCTSTSGSDFRPACKDKGFCGPTDNQCACGLECIHLAAGSYTCGDSCFDDSDCVGKTDPQSGEPYSRCAEATLGKFCS